MYLIVLHIIIAVLVYFWYTEYCYRCDYEDMFQQMKQDWIDRHNQKVNELSIDYLLRQAETTSTKESDNGN